MSLHAVILAGGSGTRFWPLSRAKKPKQFLALVTKRTLIAETFARVAPLCPSERTWVVCGKDHVEGVRAGKPDRGRGIARHRLDDQMRQDRKSTRLNSSHVRISYAVFCL